MPQSWVDFGGIFIFPAWQVSPQHLSERWIAWLKIRLALLALRSSSSIFLSLNPPFTEGLRVAVVSGRLEVDSFPAL